MADLSAKATKPGLIDPGRGIDTGRRTSPAWLETVHVILIRDALIRGSPVTTLLFRASWGPLCHNCVTRVVPVTAFGSLNDWVPAMSCMAVENGGTPSGRGHRIGGALPFNDQEMKRLVDMLPGPRCGFSADCSFTTEESRSKSAYSLPATLDPGSRRLLSK